MRYSTKQSRVILDVIRKSPGHLSAEEVFILAKNVLPSIAFGTVYRNLGLLSESGEIRKIEVLDAPDRYDKNTIPHEHIACRLCGELYDVEIAGLYQFISEKTGIADFTYELNLHYVCTKCNGSEHNN